MLGFPEPAARAIDPKLTAFELPTLAFETEPVPDSESVSPPWRLSNVGVNETPETEVVPSYSLYNETFKVLGIMVTFIVAPLKV